MVQKFLIALMTLPFSWQICNAQANSVNEYNRIVLNGVEHGVFIKSNNVKNPVLLILHGGPGFSDFYFWQTHNKDLERRYTVVTYDQRGTGLSYNDAVAPESMTFDQLERDALSLINILKERFKKDKIFLVGYSAGTITGVNLVKKHPSLFYAYIGVGQVTNLYLNEKTSLSYSIQQAKLQKDITALSQLQELQKRYPSQTKNDLQDLYLSRKWLRHFHGDFCKGTSVGQLYKNMDTFAKQHYNDSLIAKGQSFTMEAMWAEVMKVDLFRTAKELKVPVYFIAGRCDYNAPSKLAFKFYKKLKAPSKTFIWFENSGHYAPFVEAEKFNRLLLDEILANEKL
ncbi:alpha/beta fold hydrolase [Chryseobacterium echinoideorum]|uniref:alpha/beta fold hydrolase n=1 Tax=Chryseobacterium echinoideorum TaxID=1549648 RepID=UPI001184B4D4|nr:alpha/beta hydrolase [Chryseobacterium echinoideorum]